AIVRDILVRAEVLDQVHAARVRRERVEAEVSLQPYGLQDAEALRVDDEDRGALHVRVYGRRVDEDELATVGGETTCGSVERRAREPNRDCSNLAHVSLPGLPAATTPVGADRVPLSRVSSAPCGSPASAPQSARSTPCPAGSGRCSHPAGASAPRRAPSPAAR